MLKKALSQYKGKTILITGSSGFIGSTLAREFLNVRCVLKLLDLGDPIAVPEGVAASVSFIKDDVTQERAWLKALEGVDVVFHLAALESSRSHYDIFKDLHVNLLAVASLLEACRKIGFKGKVVFSSSANLFGVANELPLNEKSATHPVSLWATHKQAAENYLRIYRDKYGIRSVVLRLANVYGPAYNRKAVSNMVVNKVIASALAGKGLCLYRNRGCLRDYLYVEDAVRAFVLAGVLDKKPPEKGYYVIGSGEGVTISRAWGIIADEVGRRLTKKVTIRRDDAIVLDAVEFRDFVADPGLFRRASGWKPLMKFKDGVSATIGSMEVHTGGEP